MEKKQIVFGVAAVVAGFLLFKASGAPRLSKKAKADTTKAATPTASTGGTSAPPPASPLSPVPSGPAVVDLTSFLEGDQGSVQCEAIARAFHEYGYVIVRDPRVNFDMNARFIDTMERYYEQPDSEKNKDVHPELFYQVGATPSGTEKARDHCHLAKTYSPENRPVTICPPGADPKWRFFRRMGDVPTNTQFADLNAQPVIPGSGAFPEWEEIMDAWGTRILDTVRTVSQMAAIGFRMPRDTFGSLLQYGPHLLAPTGSDLGTFNEKDTVFAAFHYDLNFITIHGKSRFPGLFCWDRSGVRFPVSMPDGCLLLQAGKQFEILTGGYVQAGFHEVIVSDATLAAVERAKAAKRSLWRVSSTLFSHIASDHVIQPLGHFATPEAVKQYPPVLAGNQVKAELELIALAAK